MEGTLRKRGENRELLRFWLYFSEIGIWEGNKFQGTNTNASVMYC